MADIIQEKATDGHVDTVERVKQVNQAITTTDSHLDESRVDLGWRSWLVVLVTMFGNLVLVFVVVAAGSVIVSHSFLQMFVIDVMCFAGVLVFPLRSASRLAVNLQILTIYGQAFIIRDLGDPGLAGWIIQGPLLMQAVLCPIIGRLSDVVDRKYLSCILLTIAFAGCIVTAKAPDMNTVIGGGILIGVGLSSLGIIVAIPAEVLPLKFRAIANGANFLGGAFGGLIGSLGAGAVTDIAIDGWRYIFWIQAAFHGALVLLLLACYFPPKRSDYPKLKPLEYVWSIDPIGSLLFVSGGALVILALDWTGGTYAWSDAHVGAPLGIGLGLLVAFCLYEWKGRTDGIVAHVLFSKGYNFPLSVFAFAVEGWIFYSAVNSITPQILLNLGWESTSWQIAIRQLTFNLSTIGFCVIMVAYATRFKDLKNPLLFTYTIFLVTTICYATIQATPSYDHAQYGFAVLAGIGQSGPLTLILALVQFAAPHAFIATSSGFALSARAIGGAFGSAVLNAIIDGRVASDLAPKVTAAAKAAGLSSSSIALLLEAFETGDGYDDIPGLSSQILDEALQAKSDVYAHAYRLAWASVIPFVVLAIVAVFFVKNVREQMTDHVEASVERKQVSGKDVEAI